MKKECITRCFNAWRAKERQHAFVKKAHLGYDRPSDTNINEGLQCIFDLAEGFSPIACITSVDYDKGNVPAALFMTTVELVLRFMQEQLQLNDAEMRSADDTVLWFFLEESFGYTQVEKDNFARKPVAADVLSCVKRLFGDGPKLAVWQRRPHLQPPLTPNDEGYVLSKLVEKRTSRRWPEHFHNQDAEGNTSRQLPIAPLSPVWPVSWDLSPYRQKPVNIFAP